MYPKLFGLLNTYGLMIGIGVIVCLWVFHTYAKKKNIDDEFIDFVEWLAIIAIIFGLVAASVFQSFYNYLSDGGFANGVEALIGILIALALIIVIVIFQFTYKRLNIKEETKEKIDRILVDLVVVGIIAPTIISSVISYIKGNSDGLDFASGLTFLGGLIGGVVSFLIIYFWKRNKFKSKLTNMLSIAPCSITAAHGFGRVGCFFAGCCYGIETGTKLDMAFPIWNSNWEVVGYEYHLPTQLYEAIFLFLLFGVLSFLVLKKNFKHNMSIYLIAYGTWRFFIEFVRGDDRGSFIGNISPSQFWSIIMVLIGIVLWILLSLFYKKRDEKKKESEAN